MALVRIETRAAGYSPALTIRKKSSSLAATVAAWTTTWDAYARGGVASQSAALLIRSFLLNSLAASGLQHDDQNSSDEDSTWADLEIEAVKLSAHAYAQILNL